MIQRGANILFKDFYPQEAAVISIDRRKGRSSTLIEKRNELIISRYHYYRTQRMEGKSISYMSIMLQLVDEFFLSSETLIGILTDNHSDLTAINKEWPEHNRTMMVKNFSKQWPHLVWE